MIEDYSIGTRVRLLREDCDQTTEGGERLLGYGLCGSVVSFDNGLRGRRKVTLYDIAWDNGGWTRFTAAELMTETELVYPT